MKCPNCQSRNIDVYEARGYTSKESPIKECECGHVWRLIPLGGDNKRIDTIKEGLKMSMVNQELIKTDNVSVRVKRLDLDASTDWHYHSEVTDYFVCLSGVVQVETKNPDEMFILHPGQRVGIKHHQPHRIINTHDNESEYLLIQGVGKYDFKKVS